MRIQIGLVFLSVALAACDYSSPGDYNPKKDYQEFVDAQAAKDAAQKDSVKKVDPARAAIEKAKKNFGLYCSSCHGSDGTAQTPVASSLNPKPRNFTDVKWQNSVDDARIGKVIKEGGASVGLSPTMAAWGAALSDEDIDGIVKLIRSFKK